MYEYIEKNMQVDAKSRKVHRASVSRGTYNFIRKHRELRQKSEELTTTNSANANANTNRAQSELTRAVSASSVTSFRYWIFRCVGCIASNQIQRQLQNLSFKTTGHRHFDSKEKNHAVLELCVAPTGTFYGTGFCQVINVLHDSYMI